MIVVVLRKFVKLSDTAKDKQNQRHMLSVGKGQESIYIVESLVPIIMAA